MKKTIVLGLIMLVGIVTLSACGTNKLSGDYTGKVKFLLMEQESTMTFNGDKVTEKEDGKVTGKGIYKIEDNQLIMNLDDTNITADLSKDRKSFTIKSAEGLAGLANGTKFTKEEK
ncbi:conserved exported hypothetical protein [Pseudolactococcus piscium]|nr:conserved exported hypothetical protein [Lactococcus piscium]